MIHWIEALLCPVAAVVDWAIVSNTNDNSPCNGQIPQRKDLYAKQAMHYVTRHISRLVIKHSTERLDPMFCYQYPSQENQKIVKLDCETMS